MITKIQAENLTHGNTIYHISVKDSRGNPMKVRVNGKCKIWKTRPNEFRLPVKYGLYEYGYITHLNADEWYV